MSTDPTVASNGDALQFEQAEYVAPVSERTCAACHRKIDRTYYEANGNTYCERCRAGYFAVIAHSETRKVRLRAVSYGLGAAFVSSVAWGLIQTRFGGQYGIVAIAVAWLIATALRKGTGGIGGRRYQYTAVALTYLAIVMSNLPAVAEAITRHGDPSSVGAFLYMTAFGLVVTLISPFLGGVANIMGIVIIGIALYQAWRMTARAPVNFIGPLQVPTVTTSPATLQSSSV